MGQAYYYRGKTYLSRGDRAQALPDLQQAVKLLTLPEHQPDRQAAIAMIQQLQKPLK
ncbi:MAG TPA: tetratricopeptide repeat protein [Allocoleopsis sp.]